MTPAHHDRLRVSRPLTTRRYRATVAGREYDPEGPVVAEVAHPMAHLVSAPDVLLCGFDEFDRLEPVETALPDRDRRLPDLGPMAFDWERIVCGDCLWLADELHEIARMEIEERLEAEGGLA